MGTGPPPSFAMRMRSSGPSVSGRQPCMRQTMWPSASMPKVSGTPA
jgi:hypothetical protein